jgi:cell wall-associated NlpC family hydrolase
MEERTINPAWKWPYAIILSLILAASACTTLQISRPAEPKIPKQELQRIGYAIQVGAFSVVDNAIKMNKSLRKKGLKAYYFAHPSGLYRVRFGDFRSRKAAQKKAKRLVKAGIINEYYIIAPEEYAVAKRRKYGKQYLRNEIVATARRFLGMPYAWGGSSQKEGFDCSGLTMAVYKVNGLSLPHSSRGQYKTGATVKKRNLQKGDLVFFATSRRRRVSHVGIYVGNNQFIHAPGNNKRVRTESLSNSYFRENYVGARTYLR